MVGILSSQRYVPSYVLPWLCCCLCNHTKPRARGREPSWDLRGKVPVAAPACSAILLTRAFGPRHVGQRGPLAVLSDLLYCFICGGRAPPGAGRDPLEEMYGVRMVDLESLFFVLIETFGSCDSQLDCYCVARY
ncbi:hypothetical protein PAPYR_5457 [Paratrimastix pyriformis]|uniref:Uncharacterized protein n=1 Tax=Paratrimastix pyriformis TaxID=342808 RepID=A0ABQ8UHI5_9EUKA|nr:hypothetical protein PAPYR_5457 [Paratrimastix pyriformis]